MFDSLGSSIHNELTDVCAIDVTLRGHSIEETADAVSDFLLASIQESITTAESCSEFPFAVITPHSAIPELGYDAVFQVKKTDTLWPHFDCMHEFSKYLRNGVIAMEWNGVVFEHSAANETIDSLAIRYLNDLVPAFFVKDKDDEGNTIMMYYHPFASDIDTYISIFCALGAFILEGPPVIPTKASDGESVAITFCRDETASQLKKYLSESQLTISDEVPEFEDDVERTAFIDKKLRARALLKSLESHPRPWRQMLKDRPLNS